MSAAEVDVGRREIVQALMITAMVVVVDERVDPGFEVAGQIIVFQQDAVLERLMPAFDLALCLRMASADAGQALRNMPSPYFNYAALS